VEVDVGQNEEPGDLQPLIDFLRRHRDTYSVDALRKRLIAEGRDERLVDAAIRRLRSEDEAAWATTEAARSARNSVIAANATLALIVGVIGLYAGLEGNLPNPWWLALFAPALELVIGAALRYRGHETVGRALVITALYSLLPMAVWSALVGLCVRGVQG
jgi:hypothetical protein